MEQPTPESRPATVLVVDDEPYIRRAMGRVLARQGYRVLDAGGGVEALEVADVEEIDIALLDLRMPGMTGHELLERLKAKSPRTECILMTAFHTPDDAFRALNAGAYDYFEKPINDWVRFNQILRKALDVRSLKEERNRLAEQLVQARGGRQLVGKSPVMARLQELIRKVAPYPVDVLITGDSGSGKELVARAIHANSDRVDAPFEVVSCADFPPNLLETELFGHERGSFTGAVTDRKGLFERANGGTIFLDEIGELPLDLQAKFLRVLQERTFRRVGGDSLIRTDVRVLAATHRDLDEAISEGDFREDLYFRFNVVTIRVPPLRDRREDIPLLVWFFLNQYNEKYGRAIKTVSPDAMASLVEHDWARNNVRELAHAIERAVILTNDATLGPELFGHLKPSAPSAGATSGPGGLRFDVALFELDFTVAKDRVVTEFARTYLIDRLRSSGWNITRAAEASGQQRPNFRKLMKRYGVQVPPASERNQKLKG